MKLKFGKLSKIMVVLTASAIITSCGSIGGFNELLGISSEGIDANNVELNDPLKKAKGGNLPVPEGAELNTVAVASKGTTPIVTAPKIVAPKIVAPKIAKPKVAVVKPKTVKVTAPIVPKVKVNPVVAAKSNKIAPADYKFVDLFRFRSDMRAGKLTNARATAQYIADGNPRTCKLEGKKFTCGEYFISVE